MVARTGLFVAPLPGSTPAGTSPTDGRLVLGSLFGTTGGCASGGALTASGTAMQVTVAVGVWRIPDPTNTAGVYLSPADAATVTFSAGPASGSRIDLIWVRQNNYEAGDADSRVVYGVTAGTAAASPVAPALPAGAMRIGQLTVPTGVSNAAACTLVSTYPATVLPPNITAASKVLLDLIPGAYTGQLAILPTITYRWNGTAWRVWSGDGTADIVWNAAVATSLSGNQATELVREGREVVLAVMMTMNGAVDVQLCTLPDGYRPAKEKHGTVSVYNGSGNNAFSGFADVAVATTGVVTLKYASGGNGNGTQLLGSIAFAGAL